MTFLEAFCDTVIPDTDTPGAGSVRTPSFIQLVLERSLQPPEMKQLIVETEAIQADLNEHCGGRFVALGERERAQVLALIDDEVMAPETAAPPKPYATTYRRLKALTIFGYYTSEVGGSRELRYELAPGRLDADIPVDPNLRPFSNG